MPPITIHSKFYNNSFYFKQVCDLPVRSAKFVPRKNWVITGSDDMQIRVFNYNTLERVHSFEAHSDYVRCIAVHPTQPYILTCSGEYLKEIDVLVYNLHKNNHKFCFTWFDLFYLA